MPVRTDSFVPRGEAIRQAFVDASSADLVYFMRQCLERGAHDHARALGDALPERFAAEPALGLTLAIARFLGGEKDTARAAVADVLARRPDDLNALSVLAEMEARSGRTAQAVALFRQLVDRYPDYPGAHPTLAALLMPGPHYKDVLRALHAELRPRTYLEIGVASGATLALATTAEVAIGVDPALAPLEQALPPGARVIHETSDAFFRDHSRAELFGTAPVDLVFIDGLHLFEFALRDFFNAEAWCEKTSTIVLHDCVPIAAATATRERGTRFWVGDTWKVLAALARFRPELRVRTVPSAPSGLVVVRGLDPSAKRAPEAIAQMIEELAELDYAFTGADWPELLHAVQNTPAGWREALG